MSNPMEALKKALRDTLLRGSNSLVGAEPNRSISLQEFMEACSGQCCEGEPALAFRLEEPQLAVPTSEKILGRDQSLGAVKAAVVLAMLGSRAGIPVLKNVGVLTSSGIEHFYKRAALVLLGEPISRSSGSINFRNLEQLVQDCGDSNKNRSEDTAESCE
jgi:hypothetical protein